MTAFRSLLLFILVLAANAAVLAADKKSSRTDLEFFEKKIRPVLVKHCYECHSAKSKNIRGGLLVDTRAAIRKGGETGPGIVPQQPDKSLILSAMRHEDFEMPPTGKLPANVIADFEKWIKSGAVDPRDGKVALPARKQIDWKTAREFWAFRPLVKPEPPKVAGLGPNASEIDRFLQAKRAEKGLSAAPPADRRTLIRRLTFDLIGLPPKPEDIDRFVNDKSPDAVEKLVDRLLASPRFGERWGRHWLDITRFAESSGGGRTQVYHLAWRYRDYVIRSFNNDKPYSQFVREQIAGDLLPFQTAEERRDQLTATGYLMLGPTNYELQDKELLRMEVVDEQLDTMGRTFLGMTIGCARCHDHKFDPIPHEDYYALAGIMRSTHVLTPGNVSGYVKRPLPVSEEHQKQLAEYERRAKPVRNEIAKLKEEMRLLQARLRDAPQNSAVNMLAGLIRDDTQAKLTGTWRTSASIRGFVGSGYRYSGSPDAVARYEFPVTKSGKHEVRIAYNAHGNRARNALVIVKHAGGTFEKRIDQRKQPTIGGLFLSVGTFGFEAGKTAVVEISAKGTSGVVIADGVQLLSPDQAALMAKKQKKKSAMSDREKASVSTEIARRSKRVSELEKQLKVIDKDAPPEAPLAMAVEEQDKTSDYFVCIRGNVHKLGKPVPRGFLSVLHNGPPPKIAPGHSGRRELADWLVANPLTPRVYVNRVWHHLFGVGIVRTVDNFGHTGELPSHPELLNWLAATHTADGWSTKKLIRRIVLSQAYRQSAHASERDRIADPENRFLCHQNRRRLEAEAIRDAILTVSGKLDPAAGGSVIPAKVKSEFGYQHKTLRRSVYVPVFRNTLHPLLEVFDVADPNLVTGRRNTSTLSTQALYLMNSPFVMEQSRHAADKLLKDNLPDDATRLSAAYERTLGRPPTKDEREIATAYLNETGKTSPQTAWATLFQALFGSIDFRYVE